jgi:tRNA (adenine57-N1/adenine58-N1)-methyltransferase catalytic subunit
MDRNRNISGQVVKSEALDGDSEVGNVGMIGEPSSVPGVTTSLASARRRGPFRAGDLVQLTDPRGKMHTITLVEGGQFHTHRGGIPHADLIGQPEGIVVTSANGTGYLALRPILDDFVLAMPRGAQVVYPKDAARIVAIANLGPGARVVEAGVGSGALTCSLLRAVGDDGHVYSYERRQEFADIAEANVTKWFAGRPSSWSLVIGDLAEALDLTDVDAVVLDMLAPWECVDAVGAALAPGGVLVAYVATTTQMSRLVETLRVAGGWTEPRAEESLMRTWHLEGLAVRPDHRMNGHTAFLVTARRLAPGTELPARRRRPAPGAYGDDYSGPGSDAYDA